MPTAKIHLWHQQNDPGPKPSHNYPVEEEFVYSTRELPPQPLETRRVRGGVAHGVLNVPVPQIVLNEADVCALVGEGKAAGMAKQVGMDGDRELGLLAVFAQGQVVGRAVQGLELLTEEERPPWGFQARALHQPGLDGADLAAVQGMGGGEAPLRRATWSTRLSTTTCSSTRPQASENWKP